MGKTLLPLYLDENWMNSESEDRIFLTRFEHDFQENCFLFHETRNCAISPEVARSISDRHPLCYAYDMFHFENREFTVEGYKEICSDIQTMIDTGFKYILVSNPYIIELLCNEYSKDLRLIVSSQLEINHAHSRIFFDVLNNTGNISYVVVSQNHLHKREFEEMRRTFGRIELMDFRKQDLVDRFDENISYKLGELGLNKEIPEKNLGHLFNNELEDIQVIDYDLWL